MFSDDQSEKVALLFEECVELSDPEQRAAYLDSACSECPELRKEVERLLRAHEASGLFLKGGTPPGDADPNHPTGDTGNLGPGDSIGPYRLMGLIGEGSTSTVFLAEQEEPVRRWVALKIVKPGMDTRKVILRFGLERQALALMDHPGIAKLLDAGATPAGRPFFVMELVSGVSITNYCDEHKLTIPERLNLFIEVCNAVFHAHQRGIIHRDIKPDNILVSQTDGHSSLKIIDFGIAKVLHAWGLENTTRTSVMPFLGTPAYMSPEQVGMTTPELDTRTDIYSLGALLYEMLTGHPPFDPEDLMGAGLEEMCRIIRTEEPLPPSERFARLPVSEQSAIAELRGTMPLELARHLEGDLDWITLKALEKNPDRRYGATSGLAKDIIRHFEHLPVSAVAPTLGYRLSKFFQRKRKLVVAASLAGALVMVSAFLIVFMAINAHLSADQARESEKAATHAERQSHRAMVAMHVSSGLSAADDRHPDKAMLWFANAAQVAGPDDYQAEVNARRAMCWMSRVPTTIGAFKLSSTFEFLEFSKNSSYLLAVASDHSWKIWDASNQNVMPWTEEVGAIQAAAWSPEGSRLALLMPDGQVRIYEAEEGTLLRTLDVSPLSTSLGFTADSGYLVVGDSTLQVFDLEGNSPVIEVSARLNSIVGLSFSGRPDQVVSMTGDGWAQVFEFENGPNQAPQRSQDFPHQSAIRTEACSNKTNYREDFLQTARLSLPALADEGTQLLTRTGSYEITLWDIASGDPVHVVKDVCCSCRFITSPEAGLLAYGLQGGKVGIWDLASATPFQLLPSQGACILDIAFGMSGKCLITAETNGMARLWGVEEGKEIQAPLHHSTDVDRVAFAHNGRMVATGQSDGLVRVWKVFDLESDKHKVPDYGVPTEVRMDGSGRNFVLTREPGWEASLDACINQLTVYSAETVEPSGATMQFGSCVETAAFSPDSRTLAVGLALHLEQAAGRVEFHDLVNRQLTQKEVLLSSPPTSIAWNPDGSTVAVVCHSGELLLIEPTLESPLQWREETVYAESNINPQAVFTGDGRNLLSLHPDGRIYIRDATTGQPRFPALESKPDGFWSFALAEDSRHLATTTISGEVIIWDIETGLPVGRPLHHPNWVYRCRFSSDEELLVTASHDGKVRLWDWRTGELVTGPLVHPSEVYDAVFTPDNRWVLTACRDGNVRIWEPYSGQILAPPINVGQQAFNIEITPDGLHAVIGNLGKDVVILSLGILQDELPYDTQDLCLLGEVFSGCLVEQGGIRDLTTVEWLERYERILQLHPDAFELSQLSALEMRSLEKASIFVGPGSTPRLSPEADQALIADPVSAVGCTGLSCATCPKSSESAPSGG